MTILDVSFMNDLRKIMYDNENNSENKCLLKNSILTNIAKRLTLF